MIEYLIFAIIAAVFSGLGFAMFLSAVTSLDGFSNWEVILIESIVYWLIWGPMIVIAIINFIKTI